MTWFGGGVVTVTIRLPDVAPLVGGAMMIWNACPPTAVLQGQMNVPVGLLIVPAVEGEIAKVTVVPFGICW